MSALKIYANYVEDKMLLKILAVQTIICLGYLITQRKVSSPVSGLLLSQSARARACMLACLYSLSDFLAQVCLAAKADLTGFIFVFILEALAISYLAFK